MQDGPFVRIKTCPSRNKEHDHQQDLILKFDQEKMIPMTTTATSSSQDTACVSCKKTPENFFQRYKEFLFSPGTLITYVNSFLLLLGFVAALFDQKAAANWLYLASALIGGAPIFKLAAVNLFKKFDLTAGVMVSIAMIAAMLIGEYSAAALVAFMMLI